MTTADTDKVVEIMAEAIFLDWRSDDSTWEERCKILPHDGDWFRNHAKNSLKALEDAGGPSLQQISDIIAGKAVVLSKPTITECDVDTYSVTIGQAHLALCNSRHAAEKFLKELFAAAQKEPVS